MSYRKPITGRVEDFTLPFLVSLGVIGFMVFFVIAVTYGYLVLAIVVAILDMLIKVCDPREK